MIRGAKNQTPGVGYRFRRHWGLSTFPIGLALGRAYLEFYEIQRLRRKYHPDGVATMVILRFCL